MKISIMHLYYDILNLYGENGNIKALKKTLESLGINVYIKFVTINEIINLENIDLLYIGMGTINNQKIALEHMKKYKDEIEKYINNGGFVLATGNSIELFGKKINYLDKSVKALDIFNYEASEINFRIADEILCKSSLLKNYVIGFTNRNSVIKTDVPKLFDIVKGTGNNLYNNSEGFNYNNFYGTYLIGPILIRNPELLTYFINKLIKSKDKNFKIKKINLSLEKKAYQEFMNNYYKDYIK